MELKRTLQGKVGRYDFREPARKNFLWPAHKPTAEQIVEKKESTGANKGYIACPRAG